MKKRSHYEILATIKALCEAEPLCHWTVDPSLVPFIYSITFYLKNVRATAEVQWQVIALRYRVPVPSDGTT